MAWSSARARIGRLLLAVGVLLAGLVVVMVGPASAALPSTTENFLGLGTTMGGCVFPTPAGGEPAGCITTGDPPAMNGAAGPTDYVEAVNGGYAVFTKTGTVRQQPRFLNTLWSGYSTADGNACATENDGDPSVRYDRLAGRWLISQFDIHNDLANGLGPSYQCVAVSKTGDPTGGYWLYDFSYTAPINDRAHIGVWPDAYYVSFNMFSSSFQGVDVCAWDRAAMLAGQPATQQCRTTSTTEFSLMPADLDGSTAPPLGSPEYLLSLGSTATSIKSWKFHVDWTTPANTTLTSTVLTVSSYAQACGGGNCVPQPSPGNALQSTGDRFMDRVAYRNFGDHESLVATHSIVAGATTGVRWYELRVSSGAVSVFQQGTVAPGDGSYRWMGSIAQDMNGDIAVGYSLSSAAVKPSIAYTGRLASDPDNTMPQGENTIITGSGVETGMFPNGTAANRWGDFSSMSVDPSDDCTFWYVNEDYPSNGLSNWDTQIASFRFDGCPPNRAPTCSDATGLTTQENNALPLALDCTDPDAGDSLTYAVVTPPAHGAVGTPDGTGHVTYTPSSGYTGPDSFTFKATDSHSADSNVATVSLTVTAPPNMPPTCADQSASAVENTATSVALGCTDPDAGDASTYAVVTPPAHGTVGTPDGTGHVTYTPSSGYTGPDSFTFKATDSHSADSNVATVSMTVSAPPPPPDTTPPTVVLKSPTQPFQLAPTIAATFGASDAGSGLASFDVRYRVAAWNGGFGAYVYPAGWQQTTSTGVSLPGVAGRTYCLSVRARDKAANLSGWSAQRCTSLPVDDRALAAATKGWTRGKGSRYLHATFSMATSHGATLRLAKVNAYRLALVVRTCPTCGSIGVYRNGVLWRTVQTKSSSSRYRVVLVLPQFSERTLTITLRVASTGKPVYLDALGAARL